MAAASDIVMPSIVRRKYAVGEELARGKFGVVFKCTNTVTRDPVAVKVMLKKGNKKPDVLREVDVLKKLKHSGILAMTDFMDCATEYVLVTELLNGGELFDYVVEREFLEESQAVNYLTQILEAMAFCHERSIIHLDLKPENIVLKETDGKQLKIIDFGSAQDLSINPNVKAMVGTPEFIAPEVLLFDPVTSAADMWSIGVITYILLTGMSPFLGDDDMETVGNVSTGEYEYPDPQDEDTDEHYEDISRLAKQFIDQLLIISPSMRGTAKGGLCHAWVVQTKSGTNSARISTGRLKAFRARKKWKVVGKAVGFLSRLRSFSSGSTGSSDMCPLSPTVPGLPSTPEESECSVLVNMVRAVKRFSGAFMKRPARSKKSLVAVST